MSKDWYGDIADFEKEVIGIEWPTTPTIPSAEFKELRKKLIKEEVRETLDAIDADDMVELADGITDAVVVLLGTAITYGIDIREIWDIIHDSNMAKKDGEIRPDGKKLKPIGWQEPGPKIKSILEKQGMKF